MVNAIGNQYAACCRNDLPVASKNGVQLIISSTDMKVKCRNILLPLRRERSGIKLRGEGRGGGDSLCEERNFFVDRSHQDWVRGRDVDEKEKKGWVYHSPVSRSTIFTTNSFQTNEEITPGS